MSLTADRDSVLERLAVSRETLARLDVYVAQLTKWQRSINLIAPSTLSAIWSRHVLDSAQLAHRFPEPAIWLDLGSGAGFPGLIVAILKIGQPDVRVHLIESDTRKAAFLQDTARATGAPVTVHSKRIDSVLSRPPEGIEMITARALAPLDQLIDWCAPLLEKGVEACFMKGRETDVELTRTAKSWRLDVDLIPSITDPDARIVHVRRVERVTPTE